MYKMAILIAIVGINTIASPFYTGEHSIKIQFAFLAMGGMIIGISSMMFILEHEFASWDNEKPSANKMESK